MKYTVDFSMKPNGTFSILGIEAASKTEAETIAKGSMANQGYTAANYKKVKARENKALLSNLDSL